MACSSRQKEDFNADLTEYDLDVIRLNIYNNEKRVVANVNQVSSKQGEFFFVCLEISPIYSVDSVEGKMVKKRMCSKSCLFILVPGQAGKQLEEKWSSSVRKDCFIVTFTKKQMYKFSSKSGSYDVPCVVIITGNMLTVTDYFPEYRQNNPCILLLNDLIFPEVLINKIKSMSAIQIVEIQKIQVKKHSPEKKETIEEHTSLNQLKLNAEYRINPYCKQIQEYFKHAESKYPPVMIETTIPIKQMESRGPFDDEFELKWSSESL